MINVNVNDLPPEALAAAIVDLPSKEAASSAALAAKEAAALAAREAARAERAAGISSNLVDVCRRGGTLLSIATGRVLYPSDLVRLGLSQSDADFAIRSTERLRVPEVDRVLRRAHMSRDGRIVVRGITDRLLAIDDPAYAAQHAPSSTGWRHVFAGPRDAAVWEAAIARLAFPMPFSQERLIVQIVGPQDTDMMAEALHLLATGAEAPRASVFLPRAGSPASAKLGEDADADADADADGMDVSTRSLWIDDCNDLHAAELPSGCLALLVNPLAGMIAPGETVHEIRIRDDFRLPADLRREQIAVAAEGHFRCYLPAAARLSRAVKRLGARFSFASLVDRYASQLEGA